MTQAVRTIAAEWAKYERKILADPDFTATMRFNYRGAFYAGASRTLTILLEALDRATDPVSLTKSFDGLSGELRNFIAELKEMERKGK
ncbi:MAG TPA: hypothetical protein VGI78_06715 [Acetobacteraceae bacterium]|jgi:hypothetical protein